MGARDVVIVGGGPAGMTTALALVREAPDLARRVVVLEKARYPRDKYCAGAVGERGLTILRELGALPDVAHVPVDGVSFRGHEGEASAATRAIGWVVRRIEFDAALAAIARERGIGIVEGERVIGVQRDGEGAIVEAESGERRAAAVVGADGVGSVVRKSMGLTAGKMRAQVLEIDTEPTADDRDRRFLHFDASDFALPGYTWDFPTVVAGEPLVCRGIYRLKVDGDASPEGHDIHAIFAARLASMGLDLDRYKEKRFAERGLDPAERVADGPTMLVGEAAGIDPVTGEGIAQAIEYGMLAGRFLAKALGDGTPIAAWNDAFKGSRLARDLRFRVRFVRMFYGPPRQALERFLLESPDALHLGCQHFAAQPYDNLKLGEVAVRVGARLFAHGVSRALAL